MDCRKGLWLTHQTLNGQGRTTRNDITTGNLVTNNVPEWWLAQYNLPINDGGALAAPALIRIGVRPGTPLLAFSPAGGGLRSLDRLLQMHQRSS